MPINDLTHIPQTQWELRIGEKVRSQSGKMVPRTLDDGFRVTSKHRRIVERFRAAYGGEVKDWEDGYELRIFAQSFRVRLRPERGLSQWWETWTQSGGCERRCDGFRLAAGESACICKTESAWRAHGERTCKPTSRLVVVAVGADVPWPGLFTTRSQIAADHLQQVLGALQSHTDEQGYVEVDLVVERRQSGRDHFAVARIDVGDINIAHELLGIADEWVPGELEDEESFGEPISDESPGAPERGQLLELPARRASEARGTPAPVRRSDTRSDQQTPTASANLSGGALLAAFEQAAPAEGDAAVPPQLATATAPEDVDGSPQASAPAVAVKPQAGRSQRDRGQAATTGEQRSRPRAAASPSRQGKTNANNTAPRANRNAAPAQASETRTHELIATAVRRRARALGITDGELAEILRGVDCENAEEIQPEQANRVMPELQRYAERRGA